MKKRKVVLASLLASVMAASALAGCSPSTKPAEEGTKAQGEAGGEAGSAEGSVVFAQDEFNAKFSMFFAEKAESITEKNILIRGFQTLWLLKMQMEALPMTSL